MPLYLGSMSRVSLRRAHSQTDVSACMQSGLPVTRQPMQSRLHVQHGMTTQSMHRYRVCDYHTMLAATRCTIACSVLPPLMDEHKPFT